MDTNSLVIKKSKPRLPAIEYIRGISMLGVIAIHVGSQYLMNTSANIHLIALFEVASRFSVPIFFFISAFGLFYNMDPEKPLKYGSFMKRRAKTVIIPYIVWSVLYLAHDGIFYQVGFPGIASLGSLLLFGNAKYQLYFLVILIWFYILLPLWVYMVRRIGLKGLAILLIIQIIFDYWSSFSVSFNTWVYSLTDPLLRAVFMYRLNYWVMHYVFIFVLGGWLAWHAKIQEYDYDIILGIPCFLARLLLSSNLQYGLHSIRSYKYRSSAFTSWYILYDHGEYILL